MLRIRGTQNSCRMAGAFILMGFIATASTVGAADLSDSGYETRQARHLRQSAKAKEWLEKGAELYEVGENAKALADSLHRMRETDQRIEALKNLSDAERTAAEQREMQRLMSSLKDDARSFGSGNLIVSTLVNQLKAKLPAITEKLRELERPPKADFSFVKQTVHELASANPKEACDIVTRLTAGKQEIAEQVATLDKTIEALHGVDTRLRYAQQLLQQVFSLYDVPFVNITVHPVAMDLVDLDEAIGPVAGDVSDKLRQLEKARDQDKADLATRTPEIDRTIALYRAKHKTDPCQAAARQAKPGSTSPPCPEKGPCPTAKTEHKAPTQPLTRRKVQTLSDPCLSYTITSRSSSYVNIRIENTCERESVYVEHACTGLGLRPICSTCDEAIALWKSTGTKTCLAEK